MMKGLVTGKRSLTDAWQEEAALKHQTLQCGMAERETHLLLCETACCTVSS